MVDKFFDKKSEGTSVNTKLAPQNQQLAEELHKSIIKNFKKEKYMQHLKIIFGVPI